MSIGFVLIDHNERTWGSLNRCAIRLVLKPDLCTSGCLKTPQGLSVALTPVIVALEKRRLLKRGPFRFSSRFLLDLQR